MKTSILSVLFGLFAQSVVSKPAANPQITPAPLAKRGEAFVGFYSSVVGTSTGWMANNCLPGYAITTSGNYWKCCDETLSTCIFETGCLGTSILAPGTTIDCNLAFDIIDAATAVTFVTDAFCTSDLLYASLGATSAQEHYWCGTPPYIGTDYYLATTSTSSTSTTPVIPPSHTPTPPPAKKSGTGAIVGGVIGGLAVIAAAAVAIFLLCARSRKRTTTQPDTVPGAGQETKYFKTESESLSPNSNASGWGAASPATLHDSMYKDPSTRMSPPPMSGSPEPTPMYISQPMHQVPINQMPIQQVPMQHLPVQPSYQQPSGDPLELGSSN